MANPYEQISNRNLWRPGMRREEYIQALQPGPRAARAWAQMINDSTVGAMLFGIEMVLRRVEWDVETQTTDGDDLDRADFIKSCMHDMSLPWENMIADALSFLPHGFSFMEVVYKKRLGPTQKNGRNRSDYSDGRVGWRKFCLVPQDTIPEWQYDEDGGVEAAVQQSGWNGRVIIPIDKAVLFRTTHRSPWGRSVLRSSYDAWYAKKEIEVIEAIGIERDLAGLPVMEVAADLLADGAVKTECESIVRNIKRNEQEGVLLPQQWDPETGVPAWKLSLLSSGGARQFDTGAVIDRKARDIAMTLLQDVMMLGHTATGTQALATEKRDMSDVALRTWLNEIASVLNTHAVPRLLALNGLPLEEAPKIVPGDLREDDAEAWSAAFKNVAQSGVDIFNDGDVEDVNFARRKLGLPPVDPRLWEEMQAAEAERAAEMMTPDPAGPTGTGTATMEEK